MWLKIAESRVCPNCYVPTEHWVLYGQSGRIVGEATFCPICYPNVRGVFEDDTFHSQEEALEMSRACRTRGRQSKCLTPHDGANHPSRSE